MMTHILSVAGLLAALVPSGRGPVVPPAQPCTTPSVPCERWVTFGGGPARSLAYGSYPLDTPNPAVTRALIMVHGAGRNADHYFASAMAAAFLAGALENTVVLAPRFAAGRDPRAPNEVAWPEGGNSWRSGGMSPSDPTLSSFDFMDELVRRLADKQTFPNLTSIVVAGHSAGGQLANRYAMANKVHGLPGVTITYVVANPSSYAWPAALRPLPTGNADPATADREPLGPNGDKVNTQFTYGPFDSTKAPTFNRWPAGLEHIEGYAARLNAEQLVKQMVERPTTYLWGQLDVLPLSGFDSSPRGMAQGPTRRARGEAFFKYVTETLGAKHTAMVVTGCGHNDRCIFTSDAALRVIFPED